MTGHCPEMRQDQRAVRSGANNTGPAKNIRIYQQHRTVQWLLTSCYPFDCLTADVKRLFVSQLRQLNDG